MKKYIKYILVFILVYLILVLFGSNNTDNIWNYGMAHAIRMGELPYRDFNTISTPFFPYLMSLGLFIYDSYGVYLLEQAILVTILFYYIYKLIGNKSYIFFSIASTSFFYFFFPSYNFLSFLLIIIIIYLDIKKKDSDKLIGFLLGLLLITKHSTGIIFLICSMISTKSIKKSINRFLYSMIPIVIFLLYLVFNNTFNNFIDLCFLGISDFASKNHLFSQYFIDVLLLVSLIYLIYSFIKYKGDKLNYYLLGSYIFIIPIVDFLHFHYVLVLFSLVIFYREKISVDYKMILISIVFLLGSFIGCLSYTNYLKDYRFINIKHFKMYYVNKNTERYINNILDKYNSYDNSYIISMGSMFFDIASDKKITYFDIPLYGNFGHNGLDKMIDKINNSHDTYYFVKKETNRQYAMELYKNIKNNGEYIDSIYDYSIYYFK